MKGKVVVVTGAAQGLGQAYSAHLAGKGAVVAAVDINEAWASSTAASIVASGGRCQVALV